MSFVAAPPAQPAPPIADLVAGDGWWPDLKLAEFRDAVRLGTTVTDGRARDALLGGMISADVELAKWRAGHVADGIARLADVPGPTFGGTARAVILWRRAVYAYAAADLAETHSDITATDAGRKDRETQAASADEHRRNATVAIRDLTGRTRSRVKLQ